MSSHALLSSVLGAALLSFGGCSGSDSPDGGLIGSGGGAAAQAGSSGTGGATSAGGAATTGGRLAAGGSSATIGGSATGGATGTGGRTGGGGRATGGAATGGAVRGGAAAGGAAAGGAAAGGFAAGGAAMGGATGTGGSTGDAYASYRQLCVDTINAFRATRGLTAYVAWPAINTCVDGQSTTDETANTAHSAFGKCGESAQDECLGRNNTSGLVACLTSMWNEKDNAACTGCDACAGAYWKTCANCVYETCGHYVNMSAHYYTQVSCGFSSLGGWSTQDFK